MKSLQGHFLIAAKELRDPNFVQTVILVVQHDENGAMGLVMNRPTQMTLKQLWEEVGWSGEVAGGEGVMEGLLLQGGPVNGPLMMLHGDEEAGELEVLEGVVFTADEETIKALVERGGGPLRFFAGYSGWGAGQLEQELKDGAWLTATASASAVFGPAEHLWSALVRLLTPGWTLADVPLKHMPDDPRLN